MIPCQDDYKQTFLSDHIMFEHHRSLSRDSEWLRVPVSRLYIAPLTADSYLLDDPARHFDARVSPQAIEDTVHGAGLAVALLDADGTAGAYYPVRDTAVKSLLDRAKINGTALAKLDKAELAMVLNLCLALWNRACALLLIRDEKVSAFHSGDEYDYAALPVDELLEALQESLDARFPGNRFQGGYTDHSVVTATWTLPAQRDALLETYDRAIAARGRACVAAAHMPGIRFSTSDVGTLSASVHAVLMGPSYPIRIGGTLALEHRRRASVQAFRDSLPGLFAQFEDAIGKLEALTRVYLNYPVHVMAAVCKRLSLPRKAAMEAVDQLHMALGDDIATAHDVYLALHEILFLLRQDGTPEGKIFNVEENIARALTLHWGDFDMARWED